MSIEDSVRENVNAFINAYINGEDHDEAREAMGEIVRLAKFHRKGE